MRRRQLNRDGPSTASLGVASPSAYYLCISVKKSYETGLLLPAKWRRLFMCQCNGYKRELNPPQ
jgi:hypothetical protein